MEGVVFQLGEKLVYLLPFHVRSWHGETGFERASRKMKGNPPMTVLNSSNTIAEEETRQEEESRQGEESKKKKADKKDTS
jgi:hypothetical protein